MTGLKYAGYGNTLLVTVKDTRVEESNLTPFLDQLVVPVKDVLERVRGAGSATVKATIKYLDDDFRVTETEDKEIFVYRRLS